MMKYDNEELKDKSACAGVRADLKMCLLESDCCKIVRFIKLISTVLSFSFNNSTFILIISAKKDTARMSQHDRWISAKRMSSP